MPPNRLNRLFVCIGAQKAGTSWIHHNLSGHPALSFPPVKEVHYFDQVHLGTRALMRKRAHLAGELEKEAPAAVESYLKKGRLPDDPGLGAGLHFACAPVNDSWYLDLFDRDRLAVDITPAYSVLPEEGFRHMDRLAADVKVVFVLRNPVERILSQLRYKHSESLRLYQGRPPRDLSRVRDEELISMARSRGVLARTDYAATIDRLYRVFARERIKILYYETLCSSPESFLHRLQEFLGISSGNNISAEKMARQVNPSPETDLSKAVLSEVRELCRPIVRDLQRHLPDMPGKWLKDVGI